MSAHDTSTPAFPVPGLQHDEDFNGMTLRQYAAIKLRVPESGTQWLDDMIRKSLRDCFAAQAMQAMLSGHFSHYGHEDYWDRDAIACEAYFAAGAMLKERAK